MRSAKIATLSNLAVITAELMSTCYSQEISPQEKGFDRNTRQENAGLFSYHNKSGDVNERWRLDNYNTIPTLLLTTLLPGGWVATQVKQSNFFYSKDARLLLHTNGRHTNERRKISNFHQ